MGNLIVIIHKNIIRYHNIFTTQGYGDNVIVQTNSRRKWATTIEKTNLMFRKTYLTVITSYNYIIVKNCRRYRCSRSAGNQNIIYTNDFAVKLSRKRISRLVVTTAITRNIVFIHNDRLHASIPWRTERGKSISMTSYL